MRRSLSILLALGTLPGAAGAPPAPPRLLSQTGLYATPGMVDPRHLAFAPQYPLWSDGAAKSRWLHLPAGAAIEAGREEAWVFPVGTKAWKEFRLQGRKVETRLIWKTGPKAWVFASYAWNEAQSEAVLVPPEGLDTHHELAPGQPHAIPSREDCRSCHGREPVELLGVTALQLSPERDPGALHGEPLQPGMITLRDLAERQLLRGARRDLLAHPPRIAADHPATRASLGYLLANCATCHRADRPIPGLDLDLRPQAALRTALARSGAYRMPGAGGRILLSPGQPERSTLLDRMASRRPVSQMPPLGTVLVDQTAVAHFRAWIAGLPPASSH